MSAPNDAPPAPVLLLNALEFLVAWLPILVVGTRASGVVGVAACIAGFGGYCASLLLAARPGDANGYTLSGRLLRLRLLRRSGEPITKATLLVKRAPSILLLATVSWYFGVSAAQGHKPELYRSETETAVSALPAVLLFLLCCVSLLVLIVAIHATRGKAQPRWLRGAGELTAVRES